MAQEITETIADAGSTSWNFLLGTPLRIAIIVAVAIAIAFVVRRFIRNFARKVASGATAKNRKHMNSESIKVDPAALARRAQRAQTVGAVLQSIAAAIIAIITIMMILTELKFDLAPILASAGIAGVAIGFGAQSLVKDYFAGFFIVIEDQYGIGDEVTFNDISGVVEDVGLRTTKLRTVDGTLWHFRNGEILTVGNSSQGWSRAIFDVPVAYGTTDAQTRELIDEIMTHLKQDPEVAEVLLEDATIWGVQELTESSMTIRAVAKTRPFKAAGVSAKFRAELATRMLDWPASPPSAHPESVSRHSAEKAGGRPGT